MVSTRTTQKAPIRDAGVLGEVGRQASTEMPRKYTLTALLNCYSRERGAQDRNVYFVVLIELLFFIYWLGFAGLLWSPPKTTRTFDDDVMPT